MKGTSTCPSAAAVEERLAALVSASPEGHSAQLDRDGATLTLQLLDGEGRVLAARNLSDSSSCSQLAEVAATLIAAWETQLGERVQPLPELTRASAPVEPPPPSPPAWEVGAEGVASFSRSWAAAATAHFSLAHPSWPVVPELLFGFVSARAMPVGPGSASWWWAGGGVGARWRAIDSRVRLDFHAAFVGALLSIRGAGFDQTAPGIFDFEPGAVGGVRLSLPVGPVRLGLGVMGLAWLKNQELHVGTVGTPGAPPLAAESLPHYELLLALGLSAGSP